MWETLALKEMEFYKNKDNNLQEIEAEIQELESIYYILSTGYIDEQTGLYLKSGKSIDTQVANKVDAEAVLKRKKERLLHRCDRINRAFEKLNETDQERMFNLYLEDYPLALPKSDKFSLTKLYRYVRSLRYQESKAKEEAIRMEKLERVKSFIG